MKRLPSVHHRFGIKPEPLATKAICDGVVAGRLARTSFNIAATCWEGTGCNSDQIFSRTVLAVPEPETYAMMLADLGLIRAIARRRKAKQIS
jgi:hypothetical protein